MTVFVSKDVPPDWQPGDFLLRPDDWNDWWEFKTTFEVFYLGPSAERRTLGTTKIASVGLLPGDKAGPSTRSPSLPAQFNSLGPSFFSLGQTPDYYANLSALGEGPELLSALNDVAATPELYYRHRREPAMARSLLRFVSPATVAGQFHRLAAGGERLTSFALEARIKNRRQPESAPIALNFSVEPASRPPTNIHVLVGRNGVGKSQSLVAIARILTMGDRDYGSANDDSVNALTASADSVSHVVSVSFSAFDTLLLPEESPGPDPSQTTDLPGHTYIGLRDPSDPDGPTRSPTELRDQFFAAYVACSSPSRRVLWLDVVETLSADPIFARHGLTRESPEDGRTQMRKADEAVKIFDRLSSGHKIVLLTVAELVAKVEEKSLVLMDEPETHLHPPLLSSLVRCVSQLLARRNGLAIIATHSPVVLQEVPSSCVQILNRVGSSFSVEKPTIETFGENVGVLTSAVFGLEVLSSGFYNLLRNALVELENSDAVLQEFDHALGSEALAHLFTMGPRTPG